MFALSLASVAHILCGDYATAIAQVDEASALADEKETVFPWRMLESFLDKVDKPERSDR
jgi:hypothetical protein